MCRLLEKVILKILLYSGLSSIIILLRKPPIKDWIIVLSVTGLVSGIVDIILVSKKVLDYPLRLYPKKFKIHFLFDFILCPVVSILYNQVTFKDKALKTILKLFPFTIIHVFLEILAVKYTELIRWKNGWSWYHTFITMNVKYLSIRLFIEMVRKIAKKQKEEK